MCQFRIMYQVCPLKTSKCHKSCRLSALLLPICSRAGPVHLPCVVQYIQPVAQPYSIFAQIPHQGHQPPEVAHRADDLLRDTLFSLLSPHCQYNSLFLYACAVVQRVCKLKAFDPGIGPGVTAVLFRNHKILPPIADRPRFVDISHAL